MKIRGVDNEAQFGIGDYRSGAHRRSGAAFRGGVGNSGTGGEGCPSIGTAGPACRCAAGGASAAGASAAGDADSNRRPAAIRVLRPAASAAATRAAAASRILDRALALAHGAFQSSLTSAHLAPPSTSRSGALPAASAGPLSNIRFQWRPWRIPLWGPSGSLSA